MSNALDNLVADIDRLLSEMGSNLPPDETYRSWYAAISAQFLAFNRRLRDAIEEERTSRRELEAFSLLEKYAETPDDKLKDTGLAIKRKLLRLGSSSSRQNHGRFNSLDDALTAYKRETCEVVYGTESFDRFARWLYSKKCDDSCPYYRIVEGEGDARPRCTNPCGVCVSDEDGKEISDKEETPQEEKVKKPLEHAVGDMVIDAICRGICNVRELTVGERYDLFTRLLSEIGVSWENKKIEAQKNKRHTRGVNYDRRRNHRQDAKGCV